MLRLVEVAWVFLGHILVKVGGPYTTPYIMRAHVFEWCANRSRSRLCTQKNSERKRLHHML